MMTREAANRGERSDTIEQREAGTERDREKAIRRNDADDEMMAILTNSVISISIEQRLRLAVSKPEVAIVLA